jgi:hypothetical protein
VFENRVVRRIFGSKRKEVAGGWRRLHNEELRNVYASPIIVRVIKSRMKRWAGYIVYMEDKHLKKNLVGKCEGKKPLIRPSRRWKDNIRMDLKEIGWINLTQ